MVSDKSRTPDSREHNFGGDWTTTKLEVLAKYLCAYTTALKKQPFTKTYIDAFAGTGYRKTTEESSAGPLFADWADQVPHELLDGSARIALKSDPSFDRFIFIEKSRKRCKALRQLEFEFPEHDNNIAVLQGDANVEIQKLCRGPWASQRAVLFLDPYGMQVEWPTIEAVAKTQAIDLWLLFPLGIGVNRLLTKSGEIDKPWIRRLNLLLGTEDWYDEFYKIEYTPTLFGGENERIEKASNETIGRYFNNRLKSIFAGVAEPGFLRNSVGCPLYLLCFAASNERGSKIALRIANHLLKGLR